MKYFGEGLSEQHKELKNMIRKADKIEQAKSLFLELHEALHLSEVSGSKQNEVDRLFENLKREEFAIMPTSKDETIAWVIWHIARIEDLTMGILVDEGEQVFNENWMTKIQVSITDTGNALTDDEIMKLSREINIEELISYRNEVGKRTRKIVKSLSPKAIKRKVNSKGLEKILAEGGLTNQEDSIWLLDFWGKKDVAGLLLMPPTRHVIGHLNDCCKWKESFSKRKKFYRSWD